MEKLFVEAGNGISLEMAIRANIGQAATIRKEIKRLQELELNQLEMQAETIEEIDEQETLYSEEDEYYYYYTNLKEDLNRAKSQEEKESTIKNNLPVTENKNYILIINRIRAEIYKEIIDLKKLLKELSEDKEIKEEILLEIKRLEELSSLITKIQFQQIDQLDSDQPEKNKLLFLKTPGGSVYAENDLISISREYYEGFKNLLLSIEDGTFKNVKKFAGNNGILKGIAEVKDHKIRVVFDRLSANKYIILDIFVKKSDKDKGYIDALKTRIDYYRRNEKQIIAEISNQTYLEEQESIRNNIIEGLENKNLVKGMRF